MQFDRRDHRQRDLLVQGLVADARQKPEAGVCETLLGRLLSENVRLERRTDRSECAPPPIRSAASDNQVFLDSANQYIESMSDLFR